MKFNKDFFTRSTVQVAVDLLGQTLVRITKNKKILKGKIVETEAYLGLKDPCCHSFKGRPTQRTEVMYRKGGYAYVYFTYGMHYCFNVVTAQEGEPEAVLVRALEPMKGLTQMQENRGYPSLKNLLSGPAKLCQAMEITTKLSGESLIGDILFLEKGGKIPEKDIISSQRIGLNRNEASSFWPLRFYIRNNHFVSKI